MQINKYIIIGFTALAMATVAKAQNPYSVYGYGALDDNTFGTNAGMAGVGYATTNNKQINPKNPASYAAMDSLTFLFDVGMNLNVNWITEGDLKETKTTANFDYAAIQFRFNKTFACALGVMPLSNTDYSYSTDVTYGTATSLGEGGISEVFAGFSAKLHKNLYIGTNVSFLYGNITHSTVITPTSDYSDIAMVAESIIHVTDYKLEFGARYTQPINKKNSISFGFVYSPGKDLLGDKSVTIQSIDTDESTITYNYGDTIDIKGEYGMASTYGGGISYNWDNKLELGVDVTYQNWSDVRFLSVWKSSSEGADTRGTLSDRLKIAFGGEFKKNPYSRKYIDRMRYRFGAYVEDSYIKVGTNSVRESGATFGLGFPLRNDRSIINIAAQYYNRKTLEATPIKENGVVITVGASFNELWFYRRKIQ